MRRFDGPACGSSLTEPTHRDDIQAAADDYTTDSGSDSEAEPDAFCGVTLNARGVDAKWVSFGKKIFGKRFCFSRKFQKILIFTLGSQC